MSKHTIVIDFTGVQEPAYSAGMEVLGGEIVAVAFADELERAEKLETQRDELLEALMILRADAYDACADSSCNGAFELADAAIARARGEA